MAARKCSGTVEIEKPAAAENEILVKVHAASVNPVDWHFIKGDAVPDSDGLRFPEAGVAPTAGLRLCRDDRSRGPRRHAIHGRRGGLRWKTGIPRRVCDGSRCRCGGEETREADVRAGGRRDCRRCHGAAGAPQQVAGSSWGRRSSSTAPPEVSARSPCSSRRCSAPRSRESRALAIWNWCDRSARIA